MSSVRINTMFGRTGRARVGTAGTTAAAACDVGEVDILSGDVALNPERANPATATARTKRGDILASLADPLVVFAS